MHRPAIAEDHGLQQRGPAQPIDVILVDLGSQQDAHRLGVTVMCGRDQRRSAVAVGAFQVRRRQRHLQDLDAALGARIEKWRILDVVLGVHVRAGGNQRTRHRHMIAVGRGEQGRSAAAVTRRDACALADQAFHGGEIALPGRCDQGLIAVLRIGGSGHRNDEGGEERAKHDCLLP